jgi:hypothetical protein
VTQDAREAPGCGRMGSAEKAPPGPSYGPCRCQKEDAPKGHLRGARKKALNAQAGVYHTASVRAKCRHRLARSSLTVAAFSRPITIRLKRDDDQRNSSSSTPLGCLGRRV